jgi:hypothetical protein
MFSKLQNKKIENSLENFKKRLCDDISIFKKNKKRKISMDDFVTPMYKEYMNIININYNVAQLKIICKTYGLKKSGCKNELKNRTFNYLKYSYYSSKIQKMVRGNFVRTLNNLKGPAYKNRKCINDSDFLMFEKIKNINGHQFVSFKDKDGFIYGFNICSLYNLLFVENKGTCLVKNPYNRMEISKNVYTNVLNILYLSKLLNIDTNIEVKNDLELLSYKKRVELRCAKIFQSIDELGNTTHYNWFYNLSKQRLLKFINELLDIWKYRLNLSLELKRKIIHPSGKPFINLNIHLLFQKEISVIRENLLNIINKFVTKGCDKQHKCLGAYYILGALTLVSYNAAQSLPWLYETFQY